MGLFGNKKSHLEQIQELCSRVGELSKQARHSASRSLQGKYEYMKPEERADLVRHAHEEHQKMQAALQDAKVLQGQMEGAGSPGEESLAAESLLLSASLDANEATKLLNEAHSSLVQGVNEVEQFYGPRSREAKHLRKVLSQFQASA